MSWMPFLWSVLSQQLVVQETSIEAYTIFGHMEFACLRDSIETDNPTARLLSQRLGSVEKQLHVWIILNWNILKSELGERVKSGWVRAMRVYLTHVGSVTLFLSQTSCDIQHVWAPYLFPQELLSLLACR
jgi:hypothetical protein